MPTMVRCVFPGTIIDPGGRQPLDVNGPMVVAYERSGKIRLQAMQGGLVCNGMKLWEFVSQIPGQVVEKPAPKPPFDSAICWTTRS